MSTVFNTSYKVQVDVDTDTIRNQYNIEEGAFVTTESGVWTVFGGEWVKLYPHSGAGSGVGWVRYNDTYWTSENKLPLLDGVEVVLSNNGGSVQRSQTGIDYYDTTNYKLIGEVENNVYLLTIVFKASAPNANQTHLDIYIGEGDYRRLDVALVFAKGNDETQNFHNVYQYYVDQNFVDNGAQIKIMADGGTAEVWDIIYFIQKTQSYA